MRRRLAATLVAAAALAACSGSSSRLLPPPSSTSSTAPTTTTTTVDFSTVPLAAVPGQTTTTLVTSGKAALSGVVNGPEGGVPGAIVHAERLVGDAVQPFEIRTAEDGSWTLSGLPGGRFRVRAYRPPDLAMEEPAVFFLRGDENRELSLVVQSFVGVQVLAGTTPETLTVGDAANLAVRVTERYVDDAGVGQVRPVVNVRVRVRSSGWREIDDPVDTTDLDGTVVFTFECDRATPVTATAVVGADQQVFPLEVPDCEPRATTTTSTTTTTGGTSSTTRSSTTTTTAPSSTTTTRG